MPNSESYVEVAKIDEIPPGKMKHVELDGKDIVVCNLNSKFYAMDDRCGHMNALLSMGNISNDGVVTCPFHGARFDVTTGKKVKEPVLTPSQQMEPLPKTWQNYMEHVGQLMSHIKTYDQKTYEVQVEGNRIKIRA
ncbi:MAG: non-heme iron oxygenase ferredoxin subunit [Thaumarchaeota archaeon]|jgi:nitrite reductase/ring-hydroxylating ferredoxin subunit|nr:MAG: non-heme iron oxygenase ferredoxin subunit [Nitrososphaerota archaeon]TLX86766.1 MAG: non-heme iron oxygenase ferredoxin subunit [Nitrososphaerota archaeon]TLX89058.1 MAG: non-heme iron oxygenase ferredoxin subunit [Nitrososphaerota archaeon]